MLSLGGSALTPGWPTVCGFASRKRQVTPLPPSLFYLPPTIRYPLPLRTFPQISTSASDQSIPAQLSRTPRPPLPHSNPVLTNNSSLTHSSDSFPIKFAHLTKSRIILLKKRFGVRQPRCLFSG